jgi:uncharacterized OsmC-like protein
MKIKFNAFLILGVLGISGCNFYQGKDKSDNLKTYQIETRKEDYVRPTTFVPKKVVPITGGIAESIVTSTERILNKEAPFLKKGVVKAIGENQYNAWEMVSDEGGKGHLQTAPNPLTYYAAGSASSLLTQVERGIKILGLDVNNVKVESEIFFRWDNPFTDNWSGYTDKVVSSILVDSKESPEKIKELKELALKSWAVGEGLANETIIDTATVINGEDNWVGHEAKPGIVGSPISIDKDHEITNTTGDVKLETFPLKEDMSLDMHKLPQSFTFSEVVTVESVHDIDRPYMHKIQAKSLTENYETWEFYSDDSRGYEGIGKAPTSWDYFTLGTSFCLMSQLTANQMYFQQKGVNIEDFRVEHQFDYTKENFMGSSMKGNLKGVITRVIVKSDSGEEEVNNFATQSLKCCFAGEGIQNKTEMESEIYLNGKIIK